MQDHNFVRMGDGERVLMSSDQIKEDLLAGTQDAAQRAEIPALTTDELEDLFDIFGPAINVNSSESIPWNLARAVTFVKATVDVARIPVHPNVGMGVCGIPVFEVPPIDAVTRAAKSLVQIGKADGL